MVDNKIPLPTKNNAFEDGFLNNDVAVKAVKKINRTGKIKVKLLGALDGKVMYDEDSIVIDLGPMLGVSETVYLIKNGELRKAQIPIVWLS